ncbi:MAG TPA: T9SS type A sorting domain-containing protein [Bacteroidia bacterium]|nr:T9SS type A sorting domain-containing protein [Bacteroidia bacterium]
MFRLITRFTIIICIVLPFIASAQLNFQKTFNVDNQQLVMQDMAQTADSGVVVALNGGFFTYILKYDGQGNPLWQKMLSNSNMLISNAVHSTADGGVIVCGNLSSGTSQGNDLGIVKLNASGSFMWAAASGTTNTDFGYDAIELSDGNFAAVGNILINGSLRGTLIKLQSNGAPLWSKVYRDSTSGYSYINKIIEVPGQHYVMTTLSDYGSQNTAFDAGIIKTDQNGNIIWNKVYHFAEWGEFKDIKSTSDGGLVVSGIIDINPDGINNRDFLLLRTDSMGAVIWANAYVRVNDDIGYNVMETDDGGFILSGVTNSLSSTSSCAILKVDGNGAIQWTNQFFTNTTSPTGNVVKPSAGNGYFVMTMRQVGILNSGYFVRIGHDGLGYCNDSLPAFTIAPVSFTNTSPFLSAPGGMAHSEIVSVTVPTYTESFICLPSGINDQHQEIQMECYPNPSATGLFTLQLKDAHPEFKCFDACGKEVSVNLQHTGEGTWKFQLPYKGLYFLQVTTGSGIATKKLVVAGNGL